MKQLLLSDNLEQIYVEVNIENTHIVKVVHYLSLVAYNDLGLDKLHII